MRQRAPHTSTVIPDATFPEAKLRLEKSAIRDPGRVHGSGSRIASEASNRSRDWASLASGMTLQVCGCFVHFVRFVFQRTACRRRSDINPNATTAKATAIST